jgi:hypothetical protein
LLFLFDTGQRPARRDVLALVEGLDRTVVSHNPAAIPGHGKDLPEGRQSDEGGASNWLELLRDGLTFDLLGLADGPSLAVPPFSHRLGCAVDLSHDGVDAMGLFPGPHLAEGAASLPIIRTQLALAAELAGGLPGLAALFWTPAEIAVAPSLFIRLVQEWLDGGAFPVLGLVRFETSETGGLRSRGLGFFIGQEIELSPALSRDRIAGTRIAVRVIHELVALGTIEGAFELAVGSEGRLRLAPSGDGALVRIERV